MKKEECHKAAKAVRNMLEKVSGRGQWSSGGPGFGREEQVQVPRSSQTAVAQKRKMSGRHDEIEVNTSGLLLPFARCCWL